MSAHRYATVTIAASAAVSSEVDLTRWRVLGVILPSAWTAADLTFQASPFSTSSGKSNFGEVFLDPGTGTGVALQVDAAASQVTYLNADAFVGGAFYKVRSGTSGVPVNQAAAREVKLIVCPLP